MKAAMSCCLALVLFAGCSVSCSREPEARTVAASLAQRQAIARRYATVAMWDMDAWTDYGSAAMRRVCLTQEGCAELLSEHLDDAYHPRLEYAFGDEVFYLCYAETYRDNRPGWYVADAAPRVRTFLARPLSAVMSRDYVWPTMCPYVAAAGGAAMLSSVLKQCAAGDESLRQDAYGALGDLHVSVELDDDIRAALIAGLIDECASVVAEAAAASVWYGYKEAAPQLARLLVRDARAGCPGAILAAVADCRQARVYLPLPVFAVAALQHLTGEDFGLHSCSVEGDGILCVERARRYSVEQGWLSGEEGGR